MKQSERVERVRARDSIALETGACEPQHADQARGEGAASPVEPSFAERIIGWQLQFGRHDLPWQGKPDPYRIWLSEVMLQQTQVQTVIPYYLRFLEAFPEVGALAQAPIERVMQLWSGLGYYSRARNLHRCAQIVVNDYGGHFPTTAAELARLPGVGASTAAAIAALAFGERAAILDGNVKRVLARHFGIEGWPGERSVERMLWAVAQRELPGPGIQAYTQGLMDLGASLCARNRPQCERCPVHRTCAARAAGRQADFPGRRPARVIPERQTVMLVMVSGTQIMLERRPPAGIWGGLLSLPEAAPCARSELVSATEHRYGVKVRNVRALAQMRHAFSHYRLLIEPLLLEVEPHAQAVAETLGLWVNLPEAVREALPAPVRTLLTELASERSSDGLFSAQHFMDDR